MRCRSPFCGYEQVRIRGVRPAEAPVFRPRHHVGVGEVGEPVWGSGDGHSATGEVDVVEQELTDRCCAGRVSGPSSRGEILVGFP